MSCSDEKVAAIVPAFNEQLTIGPVVKTLVNSGVFNEVIVVDDGSSDKTAELARVAGASVLHLEHNQGKGAAMAHGVADTSAGIICFFDADLVGLTITNIEKLVRPVIKKRVAMNVGIVDRGPIFNAFSHRLPVISGQRAMLRQVFESVPAKHVSGYGVEVALNYSCRLAHMPIGRVALRGVAVIRKTQKLGWWRGLVGYVRMLSRVLLRMIEVRLDRQNFLMKISLCIPKIGLPEKK